MERRIIVSGGGGLRVFSLPDGTLLRRAPLAGAGALCCGGGAVYCACGREGAVFRLDAGMLMPQALFAAGPGICGLMLRGRRLYALCGEGDGVLMLDAGSGSPLVFARAGLSPMQMTADDSGALVIAGGEGGCVARLCLDTLKMLSLDPMPGPVYGASALGGRRYALCLSEALESLLVAVEPGGTRRVLPLAGMPGALTYDPGRQALLAAVQGGVYAAAPDGSCVSGFCPLPGCACGGGSRLICGGGETLLLDASAERLWALSPGRRYLICGDAIDAALLDT